MQICGAQCESGNTFRNLGSQILIVQRTAQHRLSCILRLARETETFGDAGF
jgi:hypothetical protein